MPHLSCYLCEKYLYVSFLSASPHFTSPRYRKCRFIDILISRQYPFDAQLLSTSSLFSPLAIFPRRRLFDATTLFSAYRREVMRFPFALNILPSEP